jgi:hypothetical protein
MHRRVVPISLAVVMLALASCGSSKEATTSKLLPGSKPGEPPIPSATYHVTLSGHGAAAKSSGHVDIIIKGDTHNICWAFTELNHFASTAKTRASIRGSLRVGILSSPLGREPFSPTGCGLRSPVLLKLLEANVHKLYVEIETPPHFERALRGPL